MDRVLDLILGFSLSFGEGQYVRITRDQKFVYDGSSTIATSLLRANRRIHVRAEDTLFRVNCFRLSLSYLSCMGEPKYDPSLDYFSVPARWNSTLRRRIYQMHHLAICVEVGAESRNHLAVDKILRNITLKDFVAHIQEEREENLSIVQTAVDELCNVLEISDRLRSIEINLTDLSHPRVKDGQEHRVLKPFGKLRNLHSVKILGVPPDFARILVETMRRKRN